MKQMARGALAMLAMLGISACVDDPQEKVNNDDFKRLKAYPEVAWIRSGDSTPVYFRLVNDFDYGTPTRLTLSEVTGPITVKHDSMYRRYYSSGDPSDSIPGPYVDGHLQRFFVHTPVPGEGSFRVTAGNGVSKVVTVRIEARNLGNLNLPEMAPGTLVTVQAPPFQKFTEGSQVTYPRGHRPVNFPNQGDAARAGTATRAGTVLNIAADGSSLTFRASPDARGLLTVTNTMPLHSGVVSTPISLVTTDTFKVTGYGSPRELDYTNGVVSDTITATGATFKVGGVDVTNPAAGQVVTVNLGGLLGSTGSAPGINPLAFLRQTRIFVGGIEAGIVHTGTEYTTAAISADSTTVQILVPPGVVPPTQPDPDLPPYTTVPVTLVNTALAFDPTFLFGNSTVAASTAVQPGTPAAIKIGELAGTQNTVAATNYAGTNSRATAPQLPIIDVWPTTASHARAVMVNDAGPFLTGGDCSGLTLGGTATFVVQGCKIYKLGLETGRPVNWTIHWQKGLNASIGVYLLSEPPSTAQGAARAPAAATNTGIFSNAVNGQTFAAATSQYIALVLYTPGIAPANQWTSLRMTFR